MKTLSFLSENFYHPEQIKLWFDDFLATTSEWENENERKKEPQIPCLCPNKNFRRSNGPDLALFLLAIVRSKGIDKGNDECQLAVLLSIYDISPIQVQSYIFQVL